MRLTTATRLENRNTLIDDWFKWSGSVDPSNAPVQAVEVTPNKQIVWVFRGSGTVDDDSNPLGRGGRTCRRNPLLRILSGTQHGAWCIMDRVAASHGNTCVRRLYCW